MKMGNNFIMTNSLVRIWTKSTNLQVTSYHFNQCKNEYKINAGSSLSLQAYIETKLFETNKLELKATSYQKQKKSGYCSSTQKWCKFTVRIQLNSKALFPIVNVGLGSSLSTAVNSMRHFSKVNWSNLSFIWCRTNYAVKAVVFLWSKRIGWLC